MAGEGAADRAVGQRSLLHHDLADVDVLDRMVVVAEAELSAH